VQYRRGRAAPQRDKGGKSRRETEWEESFLSPRRKGSSPIARRGREKDVYWSQTGSGWRLFIEQQPEGGVKKESPKEDRRGSPPGSR